MRWFVIFASTVIATASTNHAAELPRKIKPVVVLTGIDSKQTQDSFARCCSPEAWQAIWSTHSAQKKATDLPACPEIDFDSHMVIAIFRETSRLRVREIIEEKECIRVRYQPWGNKIIFAPDSDTGTVRVVEGGRGELDLDKPYLLSFAFVVVPKANKSLVLEEDVQHLIGKPPVWKERAKFPTLAEK